MDKGDFCIPKDLLDFSNTYKFLAIVMSGSQRGEGEITINFVPGKTPSLNILYAFTIY